MFDIRNFFIDRIWIKSYPYPPKKYYREFRVWTERCFAFYNTLRALGRVFKRYGLEGIRKVVSGELEFESVSRYKPKYGLLSVAGPDPGDCWLNRLFPVEYVCSINGLNIPLDAIKTARLIPWVNEKGKIEKWIYFQLTDFLRVMILPFSVGGKPPLIRLFVNATIYALRRLEFEGKLNIEYYRRSEFVHDNWFIPEVAKCPDAFYFYNEYILKFDWSRILRRLWRAVFGADVDIYWTITQVEVTYDGFFDKWTLLDVVRLLPGRKKSISTGSTKLDEITWSTDEAAKFYVTLPRNVQVKVYSKAKLFDGRLLNRIEFTLNVQKLKIDPGQVKEWVNKELLQEVNRILLYTTESAIRSKVLSIIDTLIPSRVRNKELHREFLLNILVFGQVKGSRRFRDVARIYKERGIIEVVGRGRNSIYRLKPEYLFISELIRQAFKQLGFIIKTTLLETAAASAR